MKPLELKSLTQVQIFDEVEGYDLVDEDEFFALQKSSIYKENTLPLGKFATSANYAKVGEEMVILERGKRDIYIIADVENFGMSMLHYISNNVSLAVELVSSLPLRKLFYITKEVLRMANENNGTLRAMLLNNGGAPVPPAAPEMEQYAPGTGITQKAPVDQAKLQYFARKYGHVLGYIVNQGPQISMTLKKIKEKDKDDRYEIRATQSKPSKALSVLFALPKGCCMKNGALARPLEIENGDFDYDESNTELLYNFLPPQAAAAYIGALGKALPEYGPTHGAKEHYDAKDILNNAPGVGFVETIARQNKKKNRAQGEDFIWTLKSTERRTLFCEHNFIPLKQAKHISVQCKTAADAMNVNTIAFGYWTKKAPNSNDTRLDLAMSHVSSQIFTRQYEIKDGDKVKTVDGIGSVYFAEKATIALADGVEVPRTPISYTPWNAVAKRGEKATVTEPLKEIVFKKEVTSEKSKKTRYVNDYLTVADSLNAPEFKPYHTFLKYVELCMTQDELKGMLKTSSRKAPGGGAWEPNVKASYNRLLADGKVNQDIDEMIHRYSRNQILTANA